MNKTIVVLALTALLSGGVYATQPGNNGGGNGGCGVGQTTNGCGGETGGGTGGGYGDMTNTNKFNPVNTNKFNPVNTNKQAQGQLQGQLQGQAQKLSNVNDLSNSNRIVNNVSGGKGGDGGNGFGLGVGIGKGGSVGDTTSKSKSNANATSDASARGGNAKAEGGASSSEGGSVNYTEAKQDYGDTYEKYTPSAYAPPINATTPCLIPVTLGVGVPGFAGAAGSGVIDKNCELRETVRIGFEGGNAETRKLANYVLQNKLEEYAEQADKDAAEREERKLQGKYGKPDSEKSLTGLDQLEALYGG